MGTYYYLVCDVHRLAALAGKNGLPGVSKEEAEPVRDFVFAHEACGIRFASENSRPDPTEYQDVADVARGDGETGDLDRLRTTVAKAVVSCSRWVTLALVASAPPGGGSKVD